MICYNGGVFVGVTPKILFLKDTTGDGTPDTAQSTGNVYFDQVVFGEYVP